jgi:hypothetical protein
MNRCVDGPVSRCNRRSARSSRPVRGCVAGGACLGPADVQDAAIEIDLVPAQLHQLGRSQAVAEGQEDHRGVPVAARRLDQALDLDLGEMLSGAIFAVGPAQRRLNCRIFACWRDQGEAWICHGNPHSRMSIARALQTPPLVGSAVSAARMIIRSSASLSAATSSSMIRL